MYPDDDFLPEEAMKPSEPTQAELDDYHEDVKEDLYPKLMMLLDRMEDDGK